MAGILWLQHHDQHIDTRCVELIAAGSVVFTAGPLVVALPLCTGLAVLSGTAAAVCLVAVAGGIAAGQVVTIGYAIVCGAAAFALTFRCSAWAVAMVWQLDLAREAQAELAVARERLRFSRDLHDILGRNLASIALKSELAAELAKRGKAEAIDHLDEVQQIARDAQRGMREVVRGYREANLTTELAGARSVLRAAGIVCHVEADVALAPPLQATLGWVIREGTTNVLRHSEATACEIQLRSDGPAGAVLTIRNDGVRLPATAFVGNGLTGLRERLQEVGGVLEAGIRDDGSFCLLVRVPTVADPEPLEGIA